MQDSNLRMHESKSCALPTWLIPIIKLVSAQGFEPRTHALEGRCSIQLSYAPTLFWSGKRDSNSRLSPWQGDALPLNYSRIYNGGNNRTRTCDPLINSQLLYQLSHIPICINKYKQVYKRSSVFDNHLSRLIVTNKLKRPTNRRMRATSF